MKRTLGLCAGIVALASSAALADHTEVQIIRGGDNPVEVRRVEHPVYRGNAHRLTKVVTVEAEDRIATLGKAYVKAMNPRHSGGEGMIHVELVNENLYVHPDRDVLMQNYPHYRINHNDLVPSAQRLGLSLRSNKASIVFGSPTMVEEHLVDMTPLMIMESPNKAPRKVIPSVPAPPAREKDAKVASAK
ncbi:MAG: hypothetical protein WD768_22040 [Phycisphaeraceae bacterium]